MLNLTTLLLALLFASLSANAQSPDESPGHHEPTGRSDVFRDCDACPEMVVIPAGSFLMGSPDDEPGHYRHEGPRHDVSLPRFALGRYEVTRQEFASYVLETGHATGPCVYWHARLGDTRRGYDLDLHNPSHEHRQTAQHPVACVSWYDAKAYVDWLTKRTGKAYRLPSESEWEYAARAGAPTRYPWGDNARSACSHANGHDEASEQTNTFNWTPLACDDGHGMTAPVGSFHANDFSLFDMVGNVWEWVEDHYHNTYEGAPIDGRAWLSPERSARVLRGGSWESEARDLRSASRIWSRPGSRLNGNGFRVALTLPDDAE